MGNLAAELVPRNLVDRLWSIFTWSHTFIELGKPNLPSDRTPENVKRISIRIVNHFGKRLPGPHTRLLYNGKRNYTPISWISYARVKPVEQIPSRNQRGRGEESVDQFLFRCPRWGIFRGEIRRLTKGGVRTSVYNSGAGVEIKGVPHSGLVFQCSCIE